MRNHPITAVHPDIARLAWEVSKVSGESMESTERKRGRWLTELVECLVQRDPALHPYGAHLLAEVEAYRKADLERKKGKKHSADSMESKDSADSHTRSDQSITDQEEKRKNKSVTASRFTPPTVEDVRAYCSERGNSVDPEKFIAHYTSNGWRVGRNPMKSWRAAVITWEKSNAANRQHPGGYESAQEKRDRKLREAVARLQEKAGDGDRGPDYQDVSIVPEGTP